MKRKILLTTLLGLLLLGLCGCESAPPEPQATQEPIPAPTADKYGESGLYLVSAKVFDMPEGMDYLTYDPGLEQDRISMLEAVSYSDAEVYAKGIPGEGAVILWEFDAYSSKYQSEFAQSDFDVDAFCLDLAKSFAIGLEGLRESRFYTQPLYYYSGSADAETGEIKGVIAYTVLGNKEILGEHDPTLYVYGKRFTGKIFEIKAQDFDTSGLTIDGTGRIAALRAVLRDYGIETYNIFDTSNSQRTGMGISYFVPFEQTLGDVLRSYELTQAEDDEMLAARLILETDSFSFLADKLDVLLENGGKNYYPFRFLPVAIYCLKEGALAGNAVALDILENQYTKLATASGNYALAELAHRLRMYEENPEKYARLFPDVDDWGEKTLLTQSFVASLPEEMKSPLERIPLYIVMRNPSGAYREADFVPNEEGRFVPSEPMKGGFAVSTTTTGHPDPSMNKTSLWDYFDYYKPENSTLFCPLDINNVQLMINETLSYKNQGNYQHSEGATVAVYSCDWSATVTDAVTGKILYEDSREGSLLENYRVSSGVTGYYVPDHTPRSPGIEALVDTLLAEGII